MNNTTSHDERFAKMTFATVYPLYLAKVEKKGRTEEELLQVIKWLTGYTNHNLKDIIEKKTTKSLVDLSFYFLILSKKIVVFCFKEPFFVFIINLNLFFDMSDNNF